MQKIVMWTLHKVKIHTRCCMQSCFYWSFKDFFEAWEILQKKIHFFLSEAISIPGICQHSVWRHFVKNSKTNLVCCCNVVLKSNPEVFNKSVVNSNWMFSQISMFVPFHWMVQHLEENKQNNRKEKLHWWTVYCCANRHRQQTL